MPLYMEVRGSMFSDVCVLSVLAKIAAGKDRVTGGLIWNDGCPAL